VSEPIGRGHRVRAGIPPPQRCENCSANDLAERGFDDVTDALVNERRARIVIGDDGASGVAARNMRVIVNLEEPVDERAPGPT
jgi:propanediol dehydratase large subunit